MYTEGDRHILCLCNSKNNTILCTGETNLVCKKCVTSNFCSAPPPPPLLENAPLAKPRGALAPP